MGGALAIASAVKVPNINAAVCFYGIPPRKLADPADLSIPMQFHFADKDQSKGFADIHACDNLRNDLLTAGKVLHC